MLVTKEFVFDAAHYLPKYNGKCEKLHGHTWKLQVTVSCPVGEDGLAFDFNRLKQIVGEKVIDRLDHTLVNDLVPNPSAELMAAWIWRQLGGLPLHTIKVWETPTSFVTCSVGDMEELPE